MADNDSARKKLDSVVGPMPNVIGKLSKKGVISDVPKASKTPYYKEPMTPHSFSQGDGVINRIVHAASRADAKKKLSPPEIH